MRALSNSNFIISMLPDTQNLKSVFNDITGTNQFLKPATIVINISTIYLSYASETAYECGIPHLGLSLSLFLFLQTKTRNEGKNVNQALFKTYDRMTNHNGIYYEIIDLFAFKNSYISICSTVKSFKC